MAAATLPLSRSMRIPLSNRQDTNESFRITDEWGPSSVPPTTQASIPWDEQVVPALRKKLEAESKDLTKRISRIQDSDNGWSHSADTIDRPSPRTIGYARDGLDRRTSREVVKHHRESSIDQFHNRFASVRAASRQSSAEVAASSFPFGIGDSQESSVKRNSLLSNEATTRAREKARQIAARQRPNRQMQASQDSESSRDVPGYAAKKGLEGSIDAIPEHGDVAHQSLQSFKMKRMRTQSNPTRPSLDLIDPGYSSGSRRTQNHSPLDPPELPAPVASKVNEHASGHQRSISLSRRKAGAVAAHDPALLDEFGPLGATPSATAKLLQAHKEADPSSLSPGSSPRNRNIQADAFRSLSRPDQVRTRESSAPPSFGGVGDSSMGGFGGSPGSKSVNSWEDQIIPTVARKLQQEQLMKAGKEGGLSPFEGLIDTWDKNGMPLSRSGVIAMQRAKKVQEEERENVQEADEVEEQYLTPGPAPILQHRSSNSPTHTGFRGRPLSQASSRRSERPERPFPQLHEAQQDGSEPVPMQTVQAVAQPAPHHPAPLPVTSPAQPQAPITRKLHDDDAVGKSSCCCIVM